MAYLDLAQLAAQPLQTTPYDHIIVKKFVTPAAFTGVTKDFPTVPGPGSHPPSETSMVARSSGSR